MKVESLRFQTPQLAARQFMSLKIVGYTIFISQPRTFSSGLIFHARFFAAP